MPCLWMIQLTLDFLWLYFRYAQCLSQYSSSASERLTRYFFAHSIGYGQPFQIFMIR